MTKQQRLTNLAVTLAGGALSLGSTYFAVQGVLKWLADPIEFMAYGNFPWLLAFLFASALGTILGIFPWINVSETPEIARVIVGLYGLINIIVGIMFTSRLVVERIFESSLFEDASGSWILYITLGIIVVGVFAVFGAVSRPKPKKSAPAE